MSKINALKKKQKKLIESVPSFKKILRTTISKYYLTCGYKGCWCHRGKRKHGPFFYLSFSEKRGKTKMYFVPKEKILDVQDGVKNYKKLRKIIYKLCNINREILYKDIKKKKR